MVSQISFGQNDTLNQRDSIGQKQGYWIIYGVSKPDKNYCDTCKFEDGYSFNGRKNGEWIIYHKDGLSPRLIGTFANGRPSGTYTKIRKYYGSKNCYESGCPMTLLNFNKAGKQHGINIYYYDCVSAKSIGNIEVMFKCDNGLKIDTAYRYYRNGDLKQTIVYSSDGVFESKVDYNRVNPVVELIFDKTKDSIDNDCVNYSDDELIFEGECRNGKIWKGNKYIYDSDGILIRIEIWKKGKCYSDGKCN